MSRRSVLLVDDDLGVLETLSPYFRLAGFDVTAASSGMAAVALAREHAFGAIVSDLRMPDISGIEVLAELRRTGVCAPFVMMSGLGTVEMTARAMKLGAADFVQKPIDGDRLVEIVHSLIDVEQRGSAKTRAVAETSERNRSKSAVPDAMGRYNQMLWIG